MTNIQNLRAILSAFDRYGLDLEFYRALNLAEDISNLVGTQPVRPSWQSIDPIVLQNIAAAVPSVRQYILEDKKIHAIKELKILTATGLKEAKDAVEAVWQSVKDTERLEELRVRLAQP